MLAAATAFGVRALARPAEFATATSSTESVLLHALDVLDGEGERTEWVVTLPPTSPFRRAATLVRLVDEATADPEAQDCLMTVTEDRRDLWRMEPTSAAGAPVPRRSPAPAGPRAAVRGEQRRVRHAGRRAAAHRAACSAAGFVAVVIDPIEAFDLNTEADFAIAEVLADRRP